MMRLHTKALAMHPESFRRSSWSNCPHTSVHALLQRKDPGAGTGDESVWLRPGIGPTHAAPPPDPKRGPGMGSG